MQTRDTSAQQQGFRLSCSTVTFNKLWERSLDGDSPATDFYYCLQQMDNTGVLEREETSTTIRLRSNRAAVECVKHSTGSAALETFLSQLKQAPMHDEAVNAVQARKSVLKGKSVSVRGDMGGSRHIKKK